MNKIILLITFFSLSAFGNDSFLESVKDSPLLKKEDSIDRSEEAIGCACSRGLTKYSDLSCFKDVVAFTNNKGISFISPDFDSFHVPFSDLRELENNSVIKVGSLYLKVKKIEGGYKLVDPSIKVSDSFVKKTYGVSDSAFSSISPLVGRLKSNMKRMSSGLYEKGLFDLKQLRSCQKISSVDKKFSDSFARVLDNSSSLKDREIASEIKDATIYQKRASGGEGGGTGGYINVQ
ncbi:hypothetical protein [Halobacteriovorax sp. CON-3]|uniref:hypothetical protein n=1 Tax=Halobacteriovorax sp. CON-3 TaxID=3157710 RepID=UPI00372154B4